MQHFVNKIFGSFWASCAASYDQSIPLPWTGITSLLKQRSLSNTKPRHMYMYVPLAGFTRIAAVQTASVSLLDPSSKLKFQELGKMFDDCYKSFVCSSQYQITFLVPWFSSSHLLVPLTLCAPPPLCSFSPHHQWFSPSLAVCSFFAIMVDWLGC